MEGGGGGGAAERVTIYGLWSPGHAKPKSLLCFIDEKGNGLVNRTGSRIDATGMMFSRLLWP